MRRFLRHAHPALALALIWVPASGAAQTDNRDWSPEERAVIEAASVGPVGIETDFDRWERTYHSSWTYWRMGSDAVRSKDDHMELVRGVVEAGTRVTEFQLTPVDVIVRGDTALLRYNAEETLVGPEGETRVVRYSAVSLYALEDGRWLVIASNLFYPDA